MDAPAFTFRLRFTLSRTRISYDDSTLDLGLATGLEAGRVTLSAASGTVSISDTSDLVVRGAGFSTEAEARKAGELWQDNLQSLFAASGIGADFGVRTHPRGVSSAEALRERSEHSVARSRMSGSGLMYLRTVRNLGTAISEPSAMHWSLRVNFWNG